MGRQDAADRLRGRIGAAIFERVAGPQGPNRRRQIHQGEGERWFAEDRPVRQVHGDSSMFIGGIRALLLQSLHPLAMAAVAQHSDYRGDPWGRLQRTSYFLAVTTFGRADDAQAAIARIRAVHEHVTGTAPDGRPYAASDPHLLTWVHIAEADSFLRAHSRFGARPLDQAGRDGYVADMARIGAALGVPDPPRTEAELADRIGQYRTELDRHRRGARRSPVPAAQSPAPGGRPGALRGAGRGRGVAAARVGAPAASPAPAPGDRDRAGPPGGPRHGPCHPLGHQRASRGPGQLIPSYPPDLSF